MVIIQQAITIAYPSPLKRGLILNTAIGPRLANCPREASIINIGTPTTATMMRYGIRKAPIIGGFFKQSSSSNDFHSNGHNLNISQLWTWCSEYSWKTRNIYGNFQNLSEKPHYSCKTEIKIEINPEANYAFAFLAKLYSRHKVIF